MSYWFSLVYLQAVAIRCGIKEKICVRYSDISDGMFWRYVLTFVTSLTAPLVSGSDVSVLDQLRNAIASYVDEHIVYLEPKRCGIGTCFC